MGNYHQYWQLNKSGHDDLVATTVTRVGASLADLAKAVVIGWIDLDKGQLPLDGLVTVSGSRVHIFFNKFFQKFIC